MGITPDNPNLITNRSWPDPQIIGPGVFIAFAPSLLVLEPPRGAGPVTGPMFVAAPPRVVPPPGPPPPPPPPPLGALLGLNVRGSFPGRRRRLQCPPWVLLSRLFSTGPEPAAKELSPDVVSSLCSSHGAFLGGLGRPPGGLVLVSPWWAIYGSPSARVALGGPDRAGILGGGSSYECFQPAMMVGFHGGP